MNLTRRDLEKLPLESLHRARNWSKADVSAGTTDDNGRTVRFVVKDFRGRPLWYRVAAGRYFLRREWNALRALEGVDGVPRALARPDADAFVMERLEGTPLTSIPNGTVPDEVLLKLVEIVQNLHQRGVTHGDLHQQNVLVTEDGKLGLIDWATASVFGPNPKGAKRWLFEELRALDERSLAKIKVYHGRHLLNPNDLDLIKNGASRAYRAVKKLRHVREKMIGKRPSGQLEAALKRIEEREALETGDKSK
jgi:aminoglycoside phosphotransferase (APT) family kinase protein